MQWQVGAQHCTTMRLMVRKFVMLSALLLCAAVGSCLRAQTPGATARAALDPVIETARAWRADAALVNISAEDVGPDGAAEAWDYLFYSPSSTKYGRITARMVAGAGFKVRETSRGPREVIPDGFVDSDRVVTTARWNGLNLREVIMGLTSKGWAVYGGLRRGDSIVWIDAKTGAYLRTEAIPKK